MKHLHTAAFVFFCCTLFSFSAQTEIAIDGLIKDDKNSVIAGAVVFLASNPLLRDTTDSDGKFTLGKSTAALPVAAAIKQPSGISIRENRLCFTSATPDAVTELSLYDGNGKQLFLSTTTARQPGLQHFALPELPSGFYLVKLIINKSTATLKLVRTESSLLLAKTGETRMPSPSGTFTNASLPVADTLILSKAGFKPQSEPLASQKQSGVVIIMDRTSSEPITVKDMPSIKEMPDPLAMNDGTKVTTPEQWKKRRKEMIRILENYEYGHMPPPPGNVTAKVATKLTRITVNTKLSADYRMMRLSFGPNEKLGFDLGIFTPVDSSGTKMQFPLLISLDYSAGEKSLGASSAALSRGYAVATIPYQQLGADANNYKTTAFFPSYPEYDWHDFSAWAWGISRAVDYLVTDSLIDKSKIMVTGTSRTGQGALLAGALDERIALTAPVAGGMAFRFSGKEMGGGLGQGITEIVDQNTIWFGPLFEKFRNQTPKLPCDQHWLPALTAPRLFIMCNSLKDEYGRAYAAAQSYLGAKPVYEFLGVTDNIGFNFRAGGHGMTAEDWSALLDFADQKLLKKPGTRKFDVLPPKEQLP